MGRKKKQEKATITVVVNGTAIPVILHPPVPPRRSWYAYWPGLVASKSTGQSDFDQAAIAAENMVRNGGNRGNGQHPEIPVLSDEEFDEIQRRHYGKKTDPAAAIRSAKSLNASLDAISAFREITGVTPISLATPDDCERFQREALQKQRNWRMPYRAVVSNGELRPNTVLKWSVALQAAFERANVNSGKKCVRGVVTQDRLLKSNPWRHFTWIDGTPPKKRIFSDEELLSFLDLLQGRWKLIPTASLFAKVSLWIWARKAEVASLKWENLRIVGDEYHFDFVGKWGIRKWARVPKQLYDELAKSKTTSPYVFGAFTDQLRKHYMRIQPGQEKSVNTEFSGQALGWWFNQKLKSWAIKNKREHASHHSFRKTALQFAHVGEDRSEAVAQDASITRSVMVRHYVDDNDEALRTRSNRTFYRLVGGLNAEVAKRYGYEVDSDDLGMVVRLQSAIGNKDWQMVKDMAQKLIDRQRAS